MWNKIQYNNDFHNQMMGGGSGVREQGQGNKCFFISFLKKESLCILRYSRREGMEGEVCVRGSPFFWGWGRRCRKIIGRPNKQTVNSSKEIHIVSCVAIRDSYATTAVRALVTRLTLGDASTSLRALFVRSVCSLRRRERNDVNSFHFLPPQTVFVWFLLLPERKP